MSRAPDETEVPAVAIRRLLVALDTSSHSLAALEAAAALAARLGAELEGLFVEDEELLKLSRLPVARLVDAVSAAARAADAGEMERGLRAQSSRAREALERTARQARIPWSFRVARGRPTREVMAAAGSGDVVCVGRAGWTSARAARLGSTARAVAEESAASVFVLPVGPPLPRQVVVAWDGRPGARRALQVGARMARQDGGRVVVLLVAPEGPGPAADELRRQATRLLAGAGLIADFHLVRGLSPREVRDAMGRGLAATLLVARETVSGVGGAAGGALGELLDAIAGPVLVIG